MGKKNSQVKFWLIYVGLIIVIVVLAFTLIKVNKDNPKPKTATNIEKVYRIFIVDSVMMLALPI